MALSIKNPHTEELARELARRTGESITEAVALAVEERLRRLRWAPEQELARREVEALLSELDALPELDARSPEEILGYDEEGLP